MRIHLLEHDPVDFSLTNIAVWAMKKGYQVTKTDVFKMEQLPSLYDFDWLMVMGGSQHTWEEAANPWLHREKEFIAEVLANAKIVLGVCFGAQLIAEILGGRVLPNKHNEIGWYEVSLTTEGRNSFLFKGIPKTFVTFHWHSDHFSLPAGCPRLAFSEATENQAFIREGSPVVGVQFHPEYTRELIKYSSQKYGHEWIQDRFVSGKEAVLTQTEQLPDTYWLMETLLDNIDREFGKTTGE